MSTIIIKNATGWEFGIDKRDDGQLSFQLKNAWGIEKDLASTGFNIHITPFVIDRLINGLLQSEVEQMTETDLLFNAALLLTRKPTEHSLELKGYTFIVVEHEGSLRVVFVNTGLLGGIHWGGFLLSCAGFVAGIVISVVGAVIPPVSITGSALISSSIDSGYYAYCADDKKPFKIDEYAKQAAKGAVAGAVVGGITCWAPGGQLVGAIGKLGSKVTTGVGAKIIQSVTTGIGKKIIEQTVTGSLKVGVGGLIKEVIEKKIIKPDGTDEAISVRRIVAGFVAGGVSEPLVGVLGGIVTDSISSADISSVAKSSAKIATKALEGACKGATRQTTHNAVDGSGLSGLGKGVLKSAIIGATTSGCTEIVKTIDAAVSSPVPPPAQPVEEEEAEAVIHKTMFITKSTSVAKPAPAAKTTTSKISDVRSVARFGGTRDVFRINAGRGRRKDHTETLAKIEAEKRRTAELLSQVAQSTAALSAHAQIAESQALDAQAAQSHDTVRRRSRRAGA